MTHSPGPWHVRPHALPHGWMQVGRLDASGGDTLTAECEPDNARLIAAAPEMLDVLKEAFPDPEDKTPVVVGPDWRRRCLALLARIEGVQVSFDSGRDYGEPLKPGETDVKFGVINKDPRS